MPRYKLTIEYDGTRFVGWQEQAEGVSIEGRLADAVLGFTGTRIAPRGAGRTDAGVHASGQVAHLDLPKDWPTETIRDALNAHLRPDPICVTETEKVSDDFDARFSALGRHYLYRIINRRPPLVLERHRAWHVGVPLDRGAMHIAGQVLVGRHDFTTFRSVQCQARSPVKSIDYVNVIGDDALVSFTVGARSFMHHQVRSIVGSLKLVGEGRWSLDEFRQALEACDRAACGPVAPAQGLYLTRIDYDEANVSK